MLINSKNIDALTAGLGPKTLNLKKLMDLGLNVPAFCAIRAESVKVLYGKSADYEEFKKLTEELSSTLPSTRYVVRSSALIEDDEKNSNAGLFTTKIDLPIENVAQAIIDVIEDAFPKLNGDLNLFSIIIQKYVQADISGICFTRDPLGNRNMVVEYHKGIGEDIVSGKIKPERFSVFRKAISKSEWKDIVETFWKIEDAYKAPQDIEWLVKNNQLYLLQARPITTISKEQFEGFVYLDNTLPQEPFLYEKTEITEIASRPTNYTLDILHKIYEQDGPVHNVYKKFGVHYSTESFLKIIGNELYVDRELEIKTLLPSYSYLKDGTPKFTKFSCLFKTILNAFRLNKVSGDADRLFDQLKNSLQIQLLQNNGSQNNQLIADFLVDYELIFEVNLLSARALNKLEMFAKNEGLNTAKLLKTENDFEKYKINVQADGWIGNALEIADETPFYVSKETVNSQTNTDFINTLSKVKQMYVAPIIRQAQLYGKLREYGRWLTVKYINALRTQALNSASSFNDPRNIFFATTQELEEVTEQELLERKTKYDSFSKFNFPNKLTNLTSSAGTKLMAVSSGVGEGILKSADQIIETDKNIVLYTKVLSPELTKFFPQISGIVSEQGGMLSHLAIIAREKGLPVLVNYDNSIALGKSVRINCEEETISIV